MSLIDTQNSIENMYSRHRINKMVREDFRSCAEIVERINNTLDSLCSIYIMGPHFTMEGKYLSDITREDFENIIEQILTIIMPVLRTSSMSSIAAMVHVSNVDRRSSFKITSNVVAFMREHGLVGILFPDDTPSGTLEVFPKYSSDPKIIGYISQSKYLPPMVCAPKKVTKNIDSPFQTVPSKSLILKSYNHHENDICLDSINRFNSVALSLDVRMLSVFDETPKKVLSTLKRTEQFNKMRKDSYEIYRLLILTGNSFHLAHNVDKRGRTYANGYHCSTQGNSFRKAIINLKHAELASGNF